jgi:hypothetical protein
MQEAHLYTNQELNVLCPGLSLHLDFLSPQTEAAIVEELDSLDWDCRLSRRVQHYGSEFDYFSRLAVDDGGTGKSNLVQPKNSILNVVVFQQRDTCPSVRVPCLRQAVLISLKRSRGLSMFLGCSESKKNLKCAVEGWKDSHERHRVTDLIL